LQENLKDIAITTAMDIQNIVLKNLVCIGDYPFKLRSIIFSHLFAGAGGMNNVTFQYRSCSIAKPGNTCS
jgi:hypothetical protein